MDRSLSPVERERGRVEALPKGRLGLEQAAFGSELHLEALSLLESSSIDAEGWKFQMERLEERFGAKAYSTLLSLLTNLEFPEAAAKDHWKKVLVTWSQLRGAVGNELDLRVAVLHYFLEIQKQLKSPTIVEIRILQRVQDSLFLDELTQLYNYRYFRERIEHEVKRGQRFNLGLSLLMIDVDDFKPFNDSHGHHEGNLALEQLARLLKEAVREVDVVSRFGGEEFAILLPGTMKRGALTAADKIRRRVATANITAATGGKPLTVSLGVATIPTDAADAEELIQCADAALYKAKRAGKNRVQVYSDDRREFTRFDVSVDGRLQLLERAFLPVTTTNVSQGGFLLNSRQGLPVGSVVQLELDCAHERKIICTAKVVRVVGAGTDYQMGVRTLHFEPLELYQFKEFLTRVKREEEPSLVAV